MRNKKRILRAVASITMAAAMVGSVFAFTACDADDGNGGGGGGSQTNTYTITFKANGGKWGTDTTKTATTDANGKVTPPANPTKDDDATNTYTFVGWGMSAGAAETDKLDLGTKTFSTSTTLFAIWKATPKGEPGPGPSGDTKTEKVVTPAIADADFGTKTSSQMINDTGFTLNGGTPGNAQNSKTVLNFSGSATAESNSLKFTVPTAGKVKVTVKYFNGNDGRYIDVFAKNTDPETQVDQPNIIYASSAATPTTSNKEEKEAVIYFWAESGVTEYYLGSHSSGIYLTSAKVESVVYEDDSAIPAPDATEITIYKGTTSYTLVNKDVTIDTSDVMVLTEFGATPEKLGYTVATTLKDGESQDVTEGKAEKAGTYTITATATKTEATTLTDDQTVTVANVTSADVSVSTFNKDLMCEQSQTTVSFDVSTIKLLYGSTELAPAEDGPWTYSYTMANTAGDDTGFDGTAKTSFTLKQDCTYSLTVTATNSDSSITAVTKTVEGINVSAHAVKIEKQMTSWSGFTNGTVLLQNDADSDGKGEGELFKVTLLEDVASGDQKTSAMTGDIATNHAQLNKDANVLKFELATGYTYKITIYAGCSSSTKTSTCKFVELEGQELTSGQGSNAVACVFNISAGGTYNFQFGNSKGRVGGIVIAATKNA